MSITLGVALLAGSLGFYSTIEASPHDNIVYMNAGEQRPPEPEQPQLPPLPPQDNHGPEQPLPPQDNHGPEQPLPPPQNSNGPEQPPMMP